MKKPRLLAAAAVLALGAALAILPAMSASAAPCVDGNGSSDPDCTPTVKDSYIKKLTQPSANNTPRKVYSLSPSDSRFKKYMLNITSKMLGASMPTGWQAEQLANDYQYDHSWENLDQQFASRAAQGAPDSFEDYVLAKHDYKIGPNGTSLKPLAAPATKPSLLRKGLSGAGSAAVALTSLPVGFQIGTGVSQMFGYDPQSGAACSQGAVLAGLASVLNGTDCDAWKMSQDAIAQANSDVSAGYGGDEFCDSTGTNCAKYLSIGSFQFGDGKWWPSLCVQQTKGTHGDLYAVPWNGSTFVGLGGFNPAPASHECGDSNVRWTKSYPGDDTYDTQAGALAGVGQHLPKCLAISTTSVSGDCDHPSSPTGTIGAQSANPDRTLTCTIEGTDGATYQQTTSATYDEASGKIVSPQCPALPDGVGAANVKVGDSEGNTLADEPTTDEYQDWYREFPDCRDGSCALDLLVWDSAHDAIASCFDLGSLCNGWADDPNKATTYQCKYGPHDVDLDECSAYTGVFNDNRIAAGAPYSDPSTGTWSGGQSSPQEGSDGMGAEIQDPDTMRTCLADGWGSANPIQWVFTPVQCALQWAFVPRQAVVNMEGSTATAAWNESPPGTLITAASSWDFNTTATGCKGDPVTIAGNTFDLIDTCSGPMHDLAGKIKPVTTVIVIVFGVLAITRTIAGTIGYRGVGS